MSYTVSRSKLRTQYWLRLFFVVMLGTLALYLAGDPPLAHGSNKPSAALSTSLQSVDVQAQTGLTYYISPTGSDANSGTSEVQAWATFDQAWSVMVAGDTLLLLDGVYNQSINPTLVHRYGEPGKPITIRAKNDGKVIIDGQYQRIPVLLGGQYLVIEGIIARNSVRDVYQIYGNNHILRRVSGYNAHTDENSMVFGISANNILLEDCVAAGSGRKMIMVTGGSNNTVRRCVANWQSWEGKNFCGVTWPWGDGIQVYNGSNNIIENSISYGSLPSWGISIQANADGVTTSGNRVLGSMVVQVGINPDGTIRKWGARPQPSTCKELTDFTWPSQRVGFMVWGQGDIYNNLFQDIFAWGNAGLGFSSRKPYGIGAHDNTITRATIINNGLDAPAVDGGKGTNAMMDQLVGYTVTDSKIGGTSYNGQGAQLTYRYQNGQLTNVPLWPWSMESRIQSELGFSVTNLMTTLIESNTLPNPPASSPTPTPTALPTTVPTTVPTAVPTAVPTTVPITKPPSGPASTAAAHRVNAPRFDGKTMFSEQSAIFWLGKVDQVNNYGNVRVGYNDERLEITVHVFDRRLWYKGNPPTAAELAAWDAVSIYLNLNGNTGTAPTTSSYQFIGQLAHWEPRANYQAAFRGNGADWVQAPTAFTTSTGWRGNSPNVDGADDMGWYVSFSIPFASLGLSGAPQPTDVWGLAVAIHDRDQADADNIPDQTWPVVLQTRQPASWGQLHFDQPVYQAPAATKSDLVTIRQGLNGAVVPDADVGGNSTCGESYKPEEYLWDRWGNANFAGYGQINIQNQWDIADWPCYSKYYVTFPLESLPKNKSVISATLTMYLFGNAGWEEPSPSLIQVLTIADDWNEASINWNNAPLATENVASTWVYPVPGAWSGWPGIPYTWDISQAVADAYRTGQPVRLVLFEADGDYHSGKYFSSSDTPDWNAVARPTLKVQLGTTTQPVPTEPVEGDVSCDQKADIVDVLFVLQHNVGMRYDVPICPLDKTDTLVTATCDTNGDNACNVVDALFVLQCSVSITNPFCPSEVTGGKNVPEPVQFTGDPGEGRNFTSEDVKPGDIVTLLVTGNTGTDAVSAATLDLSYDPALVQPIGCNPDPNGLFDQVTCNVAYERDGATSDTLRFNAVISSGATGNLPLATVKFIVNASIVNASVDLATLVQTTPVTWVNAQGEPVSIDAVSVQAKVTEVQQSTSIFLPAVHQ